MGPLNALCRFWNEWKTSNNTESNLGWSYQTFLPEKPDKVCKTSQTQNQIGLSICTIKKYWNSIEASKFWLNTATLNMAHDTFQKMGFFCQKWTQNILTYCRANPGTVSKSGSFYRHRQIPPTYMKTYQLALKQENYLVCKPATVTSR